MFFILLVATLFAPVNNALATNTMTVHESTVISQDDSSSEEEDWGGTRSIPAGIRG